MDAIRGFSSKLGNMFKYNNLPKSRVLIKYIAIAVVVVLLLGSAYYVYKNYLQERLYPSYVANKEFVDDDTPGSQKPVAELIMFTVDWCPHCKKAKPTWEKFKADYNGKSLHNYEIVVTTVNCTNEDDINVKNMLNKYKIDGYPTIKLLKGDEVFNYDAKPSYDTLEQFLSSVLN